MFMVGLYVIFFVWIILRVISNSEDTRNVQIDRDRAIKKMLIKREEESKLNARVIEIAVFLHSQLHIYCPTDEFENYCLEVARRYPQGSLEYLREDPFLLSWSEREKVRLKKEFGLEY